MISEKSIRALVEGELADSHLFIVDLKVSSSNAIRVLIDGDEGAPISDCVKVSRIIEGSLDREVEDFELQVSTPGADQPIKIWRQYNKHVGRELEVKLVEGGKITGVLEEVKPEELVLKTREKRRIEGRKAKEWVEETHNIGAAAIKQTKVIISFK